MNQTPPRWDLTNIYTSLEDPRFTQDFAQIKAEIEALQAFYTGSFCLWITKLHPKPLPPRFHLQCARSGCGWTVQQVR
jgi:hypothetical protein